jgi:membrane associated rhomboid family serine protease
VESRFNVNFNYLGIYPRTIKGLRGILFSPFIHGNTKHLINNAMPLFVLTTALFYFYRNIRWKVLLYGILLTGLFTWLIGRPSLHIGASGVMYMLTAFLMFKGILSRHYQLTALSFTVIFLYGSFIWYIFPTDPKISWEGHLSGFLVGILFAFIFKQNPISKKKYDWEQEDFNPEEDDFLKQFDEDGNFIETFKQEIPEPDKDRIVEVDTKNPSVTVNYTFKSIPKNPNKDL